MDNAEEVVILKQGNYFILSKLRKNKIKTITNIDIVFPVVHGTNTEDGTIAGYLESIGVPYVGSGILGSALGQNKYFMKKVLKYHDIPLVDSVAFNDQQWLNNDFEIKSSIEEISFPVIVKPASLRSRYSSYRK